jgi:hypothetical protein
MLMATEKNIVLVLQKFKTEKQKNKSRTFFAILKSLRIPRFSEKVIYGGRTGATKYLMSCRALAEREIRCIGFATRKTKIERARVSVEKYNVRLSSAGSSASCR